VDGPVPCDNRPTVAGNRRYISSRRGKKSAQRRLKRSLGTSVVEGHIVARIVNMEAKTTFKPFKLGPGETVYEWLDPSTRTMRHARAIAFIKLKYANGRADRYPLSIVARVRLSDDGEARPCGCTSQEGIRIAEPRSVRWTEYLVGPAGWRTLGEL
jgi:hypothetical protein